MVENMPRPNPEGRVTLSAINSGFTLLMQQTSSWIVVTLVILSISIGLMALGMIPMIILGGGLENWMKEAAEPWTAAWLLQYVVSLPVTAWVTCGALNVALKQIRGGYVKPDDLFSVGRAFLKMLVYSAVLIMINLPIAAASPFLSVVFSF